MGEGPLVAVMRFTEAQRRAALLRVWTAESFSNFRKLTREEIANYYGAGKSLPKPIWLALEKEGLISFGPLRLTDAGRVKLGKVT